MATTTPNYAVDYEDKRLTDIKTEGTKAVSDSNSMYKEMIDDVDSQYKKVADQIQSNTDLMVQTHNENKDFQVKQIEQQKKQAEADYTKEQSGAYVDFQKQSNQYGVNAEQMAMQGLAGSGYSESSKVAMYNQYQNRVAVARETLSKVIMNYDNNIQQAILQNNSTIAQIQSEASLKQAEILLEGFNQKNTLLQQQAEREMQLKSFYQNKWQSELNQINTENALAEQVRQAEIEQANKDRDYQLQLRAMENAEAEAKRKAEIEAKEIELAQKEYNANYGENGIFTMQAKEQQQQKEQQTLAEKGEKYGNSAETVKKAGDNYYFNNGYQPRYYNNYKLEETGMKSDFLSAEYGIPAGQNVWKAGSKYYVWSGEIRDYIEVSKDKLFFSNGYQPRYIGGTKLSEAGKIKDTIGSYGNLPTSQNVWKAGSKYYVWDGKSKSYKEVTTKYNKYLKNKKTDAYYQYGSSNYVNVKYPSK